jgi:hypothetical protein
MKIDFRKLSFPKGLNLELLKPFLTEQKLRKLIAGSAKKSRRERKVILPSDVCLRKIICHWLWNEILAGRTTWPKVKAQLKKSAMLKDLKFDKVAIKRLWRQREREILKEKQ